MTGGVQRIVGNIVYHKMELHFFCSSSENTDCFESMSIELECLLSHSYTVTVLWEISMGSGVIGRE